MKIKLAILENDQSYLGRIVTAFSTKYADKFEIYSFTNKSVALSTLESTKIDVLLASDLFEIDVKALPKRCSFAYFVDSAELDTVNGQRAICKFQKAELIYKQILSIYAENAGNLSGLKLQDDGMKIIAFSSPCGGVGTSSMAAACSRYYASRGKRTLYLNLEKFGSSDVFFSAEGRFDMSDIIYALKSKKANLPLKLESCVKQDEHGVFFYSKSKIALDMLELNNEDMIRLISELQLTGSFDYIILDIDFSLDREAILLFKKAHALVMISDGSESSNNKIFRAYSALSVLEQNADTPLTNRLVLMYNKFSNKLSKALTNLDIKNIGGAPRYEHASEAQVLNQLSSMSMFEKIE